MKYLSVKIAVGASLVYAFIAIFFNIFTALFFVASPDIIASAPYNIFKVAVSILILPSVSVGFFASIVVLLRHAHSRLVGFLSLTLSSVGLSQGFTQISLYLGRLIHFGLS